MYIKVFILNKYALKCYINVLLYQVFAYGFTFCSVLYHFKCFLIKTDSLIIHFHTNYIRLLFNKNIYIYFPLQYQKKVLQPPFIAHRSSFANQARSNHLYLYGL